MTLEQGQSIDLDTRVDGGMVVTRDSYADDVVHFERSYESLSRYEIRQIAEAIGLELKE